MKNQQTKTSKVNQEHPQRAASYTKQLMVQNNYQLSRNRYTKNTLNFDVYKNEEEQAVIDYLSQQDLLDKEQISSETQNLTNSENNLYLIQQVIMETYLTKYDNPYQNQVHYDNLFESQSSGNDYLNPAKVYFCGDYGEDQEANLGNYNQDNW